MSESPLAREIAAVSDLLVHVHAALHLVLPRVGQKIMAEGVQVELRNIGDKLLDGHTRLQAVLNKVEMREES